MSIACSLEQSTTTYLENDAAKLETFHQTYFPPTPLWMFQRYRMGMGPAGSLQVAGSV